MVLSLILSYVAALFALSIARGHFIHVIPFAAVVVLLFPWPITRFVLIPLGWWRAAWHFAQLSGWVWRGDVPGGQLVAGAWALIGQQIAIAAMQTAMWRERIGDGADADEAPLHFPSFESFLAGVHELRPAKVPVTKASSAE